MTRPSLEATISAALIVVSAAYLPSWLAAPIFLLVWLRASWRVGAWLDGASEPVTQTVLGGAGLTALASLILTLIYFVHGASFAIVVTVTSALAFGAVFLPPSSGPGRTEPRGSRWENALLVAAVVADAALIAFFFISRTGEPMRTPWEVVPWDALVLYGATTLILLLIARRSRSTWFRCALSLHLFAAFAAAEAVYRYGFGFDPFIHRTAELHIVREGFILPKQPYYTGQYMLVTALHWLAKLSVETIDRWLVPVLAAVTLPWLLPFSLERGWGAEKTSANFWSLGLLLLPLPFFTFTVPSNIAALLLLVVALLLPAALGNRRLRIAVLVIVLAALATHPLFGAVAAGIAVSFWIWQRACLSAGKARMPIALGLTVLINAAVLPAMFAWQNLKQGQPAFLPGNPFTRFEFFRGLFSNPYAAPGASFSPWDILYQYQTLLPFLLAIGAICGFLVLRKHKLGAAAAPYLATAGGLLIAMFIMSTSIRTANIIGSEQLEFALRLKEGLGLICLVLILAGAANVACRWMAQGSGLLFLAVTISFVILMTAAWYLSYPQYNLRVQYSGWGVSDADFAAVKLIASEAGGTPHVVISDQMLSVTALSVQGFRDLPYAIPTGGALYQYFLAMSYYQPDRATMESAMDFAGVRLGFFAIHDYYPGFSWLVDTVSRAADATYQVSDGRIVIFLFRR